MRAGVLPGALAMGSVFDESVEAKDPAIFASRPGGIGGTEMAFYSATAGCMVGCCLAAAVVVTV